MSCCLSVTVSIPKDYTTYWGGEGGGGEGGEEGDRACREGESTPKKPPSMLYPHICCILCVCVHKTA